MKNNNDKSVLHNSHDLLLPNVQEIRTRKQTKNFFEYNARQKERLQKINGMEKATIHTNVVNFVPNRI